jgi:hypothetical protein
MKSRTFWGTGLIVALLLLTPASTWAEDTVKLKDGTVLTGTIAAKSDDGVMFYFIPKGYDTSPPQGEFSKKSFFDKDGPRWISLADVDSLQLSPVLLPPAEQKGKDSP